MKILFLGLFYDKEGLQQSYETSCGVQVAPHRFQTLLIDGLRKNGAEIQAVHVLPGPTFLHGHKKLFIKGKRWEKDNYRIGYLNLPFFKQRAQEKKAYREMKRALTGEYPPECIVCYYVHLPFLKALQKIKKRFPKVKTVLIMTEAVPGRGDIVDTPGRKRLGDKMVKLSHTMDGFCLISKHLTTPMEVGERPYFVLEGLADEKAPLAGVDGMQKKTFLYTGGVYARFNVDTLIDAFAYLPDATLWLCGRQSGLEDRLQNSPNVCHFGEVPFEQVQEYRAKCAYLINPRVPTGTYTRYSFPSKTMEYLVSGKPTAGYLLEGIGEEYHPYINLLQGRDAKSLADDLRKLMDEDYTRLREKALQAREFLLREKTSRRQAEKLIDFLKTL